jgi:hypothetical protein
MSSSSESFVSLAISGHATADQIDDYVDRWHSEPGNLSLHEFLGMSRDEYALWVRSPDMLGAILTSRKAA